MLLTIARRLTSVFRLLIVTTAILTAVWSFANWMVPAAEGPHQVHAASSAVASIAVTATPPANKSDEKFATVGDRVQLEFYERLSDEDATWAARRHTRRPAKSFQLRSELTGAYEVKEDGNVVLPLLGPVRVKDRTIGEFEADVATVFERMVGRFAFVSVNVERKPIYIVGPVKKPGPHAFTVGMTVLHAVAIAGGIDRVAVDTAYMLRAVQEAGSQQKTADQLKRYWARLVVLEAERDGKDATIPTQLGALAGDAEAKAMIEAEKSVRMLDIASRKARLASLDASHQSLIDEIKAKKARAAQVSENIDIRTERVRTLRFLKDSIKRASMVQAETDLSDIKERQHEANALIDDAQNRLQQIDKDRLTLINQAQIDLQREIMSLKDQITESTSAVSANEAALDIMRANLVTGEAGPDGSVEYDIVRPGAAESTIVDVRGTAELKSGDLVRVKIGKTGKMRERAPR